MLQLPKVKTNSKKTEGLCKCRPICKNHRQEWKEQVPYTSELMFEEKYIKYIVKDGQSLQMQSKYLNIKQKWNVHKSRILGICQAPIDNIVDTCYLNYTDMAIRIGAMNAVRACCAFCKCAQYCTCSSDGYMLHDADRLAQRRADMRKFDARVKTDPQHMRIMYDKI